ncbi:MAG TPA: hypothetical protein VGE02_11455 [Gemmatimonadales bacterium]
MALIPPDHRVDASGAASPNQLLMGAARRASDGALALLAGAGLVVTAVIVALRPEWWPFVLPAISVAAFGGWGILDRVASDMRISGTVSPAVDGMLDGARAFVALAGWCSALAFFALVIWHPLAGVIH